MVETVNEDQNWAEITKPTHINRLAHRHSVEEEPWVRGHGTLVGQERGINYVPLIV